MIGEVVVVFLWIDLDWFMNEGRVVDIISFVDVVWKFVVFVLIFF